MDDLRELYQQVILDHNKNPKNYGKLECANCSSEGYNPLCGDHINLYLQVENGRIRDVSFEGSGCAISKASASLMTAELKGKSVGEAKHLFEKFQHLVTSGNSEEPDLDGLGKLAIFAGVREFPLRVKCASLAWHTMSAALHDGAQVVSTE